MKINLRNDFPWSGPAFNDHRHVFVWSGPAFNEPSLLNITTDTESAFPPNTERHDSRDWERDRNRDTRGRDTRNRDRDRENRRRDTKNRDRDLDRAIDRLLNQIINDFFD